MKTACGRDFLQPIYIIYMYITDMSYLSLNIEGMPINNKRADRGHYAYVYISTLTAPSDKSVTIRCRYGNQIVGKIDFPFFSLFHISAKVYIIYKLTLVLVLTNQHYFSLGTCSNATNYKTRVQYDSTIIFHSENWRVTKLTI